MRKTNNNLFAADEPAIAVSCPKHGKETFHSTVVPTSQLFIDDGAIKMWWRCGYCCYPNNYYEKTL